MKKRLKVIVIGGTGFVGRNVVEALVSKYEVISVSYSKTISGIKNIHTDLISSSFSFLKKERPDYVVYLGTVSSPRQGYENPDRCVETNVTAPLRMLRTLKEVSVKKVIFFSSVVLYKEKSRGYLNEQDSISPHSGIYAFSKHMLENIAGYYGDYLSLPITVFRLANTYGPYQDVNGVKLLTHQMFDQALIKRTVIVQSTKPIRDWVYVGDVAKAVKMELSIPGGGTFNLATGYGKSVGDLAKWICSITNANLIDKKESVDPPYRVICDISKIKKRYNWKPDTSFQKGLEETLKYYKRIGYEV